MVPFSPVPVTVGVVSLVLPPAAMPSTLLISGISGSWLSTVTVMVSDTTEALPAASVAMTVKLCDPSASGVSERHVQLPLRSTTTSPTSTLPSAVWS